MKTTILLAAIALAFGGPALAQTSGSGTTTTTTNGVTTPANPDTGLYSGPTSGHSSYETGTTGAVTPNMTPTAPGTSQPAAQSPNAPDTGIHGATGEPGSGSGSGPGGGGASGNK